MEVVADAAGDGIGERACQSLFSCGMKWSFVIFFKLAQKREAPRLFPSFAAEPRIHHAANVRPAQTHRRSAREFTRQCIADQNSCRLERQASTVRKSGICERLISDIESKPVSHIHTAKGRPSNTKADSV